MFEKAKDLDCYGVYYSKFDYNIVTKKKSLTTIFIHKLLQPKDKSLYK